MIMSVPHYHSQHAMESTNEYVGFQRSRDAGYLRILLYVDLPCKRIHLREVRVVDG